MEIQSYDVIVIGAGIAGLELSRGLLEAGRTVALLEARNRVGGRIHTLHYPFSRPVDAGAEFVHGSLPFTRELAKKAGSSLHKQKGKIYKYENGTVEPVHDFIEGHRLILSRLNHLKEDMPLSEFLEKNFAGEEYAEIKHSFARFVEGFDAADVGRISALAVREELGSDAETAYRLSEGYGPLVEHLYQQCLAGSCRVSLSTPAKEIIWQRHQARVPVDGHFIEGRQLAVTVPLGILVTKSDQEGHIIFDPPLDKKLAAAKDIGFGSVVKVVFEFKQAFWHLSEFKDSARQLPKLGFLLSDNAFPTWWTYDITLPFLTGWAGGPYAERLRYKSGSELFYIALSNLAEIFAASEQFIEEQIVSHYVVDWGAEVFSRGAYSYETVATKEARHQLLEPEDDTIFFCGEALNEGESMGTVEAALASARQCLKRML